MNHFKIFMQNFVFSLKYLIVLNIKNVYNSLLGKSILWFTITFIFGLFQLWIVLGQTYILGECVWTEIRNQVMDGALLFFSTAITASLATDYFLLRNISFSKGQTGWLFVFFPAVILACVISIFSVAHLKPKMSNFEIVFNLELVILTITFIYAVVVKVMLEYHLKEEFILKLKKQEDIS